MSPLECWVPVLRGTVVGYASVRVLGPRTPRDDVPESYEVLVGGVTR